MCEGGKHQASPGHTHTRTHTHARTHAHTHTYAHTRTHTHTRTHAHTRTVVVMNVTVDRLSDQTKSTDDQTQKIC